MARVAASVFSAKGYALNAAMQLVRRPYYRNSSNTASLSSVPMATPVSVTEISTA